MNYQLRQTNRAFHYGNFLVILLIEVKCTVCVCASGIRVSFVRIFRSSVAREIMDKILFLECR